MERVEQVTTAHRRACQCHRRKSFACGPSYYTSRRAHHMLQMASEPEPPRCWVPTVTPGTHTHTHTHTRTRTHTHTHTLSNPMPPTHGTDRHPPPPPTHTSTLCKVARHKPPTQAVKEEKNITGAAIRHTHTLTMTLANTHTHTHTKLFTMGMPPHRKQFPQ